MYKQNDNSPSKPGNKSDLNDIITTFDNPTNTFYVVLLCCVCKTFKITKTHQNHFISSGYQNDPKMSSFPLQCTPLTIMHKIGSISFMVLEFVMRKGNTDYNFYLLYTAL